MSGECREKVTILVIERNKEPEVIEVENHYKALQSIIGGRICFIPFDKDNETCEIMADDEYLLNNSEFNRYIQSDYHTVKNGGATAFGVPIYGTFAVVRHDFPEGNLVSLTNDDIVKYERKFKL